ncbi:MAG TPA: hypothetical protein VJZ00_21865 [Thermoanaerobaculia bacterium]|nr:hypothetical protein [Thermoanaerobaculia bacterium]
MRRMTMILALMACCLSAHAQNERNNWIFGYHTGANFGPVLYSGIPSINSIQAASSISSSSGVLQFYTDGVRVWNRNHAVMPGVVSTPLLGDVDASVLIVPKPGSGCNEYYIFTTESPFHVAQPTLRYSLVQMNATSGGGLGDVVLRNVVLQTSVSAQVTAVGDGTGNYWVMAHSSGIGSAPNNLFYPFYVSATGVTAMPPSTGVAHITGYNVASGGPYPAGWRAVGQMKFSHDGTRVASAVPSKYVELCNFNKVTGQVSGCMTFNSDLAGPHAPFDASTVFGIEFSPLGHYLYVSTYGEALPPPGAYCQLVQFDLQNTSNPGVVVATSPWQGVADMGHLQLAADGAIYLARQSKPYISKVPNPELAYPSCGFVQVGKSLSLTSSWGLPNMVQGPFTCGTPSACPAGTTATTINGVTFCCSTSDTGQTCCKRLCPVGSSETTMNGTTLCCTAQGGGVIGSETEKVCCAKP